MLEMETVQNTGFDASKIQYDKFASNKSEYNNSSPFPHTVFSNIYSDGLLEEIISEFSKFPGDIEQQTYGTFSKRRQSNIRRLGPHARQFVQELNSPDFIQFLEYITGIEGLIPDPYLVGGGTHEIGRGDLLKVHTDFNWHKKLKVHRRLNLIVYLNRDWKPEWKGDLELWDKKMVKCVKKISPVFNRTILFSTDDNSHHGHPDPLECPPDRSRRSIALYYYTAQRPVTETKFGRSTLTNFQERPGETFSVNRISFLGSKLSLWFPPLRHVVQLYRKKNE